jgi:RNA polymerase sigma-70 factor (ECF subfamily)
LKERADAEYDSAMEARASAWMTRAKGGDPAAFDELTQALRNRAFQLARAWVGSHDDALELAQEAFLKTYRARDTYRDGEPFLPWFHRILRNTCYSFLRQLEASAAGLGLRAQPGGGAGLADRGRGQRARHGRLARRARRRLLARLHRLSAKDREILGLRHFQELPYAAIARRLGIPRAR